MNVVPARRAHPLQARLAALGGLLLVEGALLAGTFDAAPLLRGTQAWWARILANLGFAMPLVTAIATAIVILGGTRLWRLVETSAAAAPARRAWPFAVAHAIAFVAFFSLTAVVFDGVRDGVASAWWAIPWTVAGVAAVLAACGAVLPREVFVFVARQGGLVLVACAAVGVAAWAAGQVTHNWWEPLGRATLVVVGWLLRLFASDPIVVPEEFIVGTRTFQVEIADKCSGYEGIGLIWVFLAAFLWVFRARLRFPRALILLPIGTVIIWVVNALRIAALLGVGTLVSPEVAVGGFHANSGSLLLSAVTLGIAWAAQRSSFLARPDVTDARATLEETSTRAAAYVIPLLAIVATAMATGTFVAGGFDPLYGLRVAAAGAVLWMYRRDYQREPVTWSWVPVGVGIAVLGLWLALEPAPTNPDAHPIPTGLATLSAGGAAFWIACRVLGAAVTVPLAEELAFRGYLLRRLVDRDFERVPPRQFSLFAFLASSLLFGLMHDRLVAGTLAGMLYAGVVHRRGRLADAVIAHATTNALLAAYVLATGSWWLW
jgi:exosortase E/protease (VPEID-CTERM system)